MSESYTFEVTTDYPLIHQIITDPSVFDWVVDDAGAESLHFPLYPTYLLVKESGKPVGFWVFVSKGAICAECHVCLLPEARGKQRSDPIFQGMLSWLWANTRIERLIGEIPVHNRRAMEYVRRNGMKAYGSNPGAWLKNGQRWDMLCVGLTRP
jgi:RimJ/RimL family protein N-acetyltransferase